MIIRYIASNPLAGTTIDSFWNEENPASVPEEKSHFHNGFWEVIVRSDGLSFKAGVWRLLLVTPTKEHPCVMQECNGFVIVPTEHHETIQAIETSIGSLSKDPSKKISSLITIKTWSEESGAGHVAIICDFLESSIIEINHSIH